jgi:hypothetical protein
MIVSKPVAIHWARAELGDRWHKLIEQAVASQYGKHSEFLEETLTFLRFVRAQTLKIDKPQPEAGSS